MAGSNISQNIKITRYGNFVAINGLITSSTDQILFETGVTLCTLVSEYRPLTTKYSAISVIAFSISSSFSTGNLTINTDGTITTPESFGVAERHAIVSGFWIIN